MKKHLLRLAGLALSVALLCCWPVSSSFGRVYQSGGQPKPFLIKGIVTVQFEDNFDTDALLDGATRKERLTGTSLGAIMDTYRIEGARKLFPWRKERPPVNSGLRDLSRFYELQFPDTVAVEEVVAKLLDDPAVRHAEAVYAYPVYDITPNDPDITYQWYDDKMLLPAAWELETGSDSIKLGMIDTGVNYKHGDLYKNIWVNPGEDLDGDGVVYDVDDLNGVDDDGNGVVDDLVGYDFLTGIGTAVMPGEDGSTPDPDPNDFDGHGTFCAGIAAASTNDLTGITGIAGGWYGGVPAMSRGCQIICLRVGAQAADSIGYVNPNNCATAIDYAVMMGAQVINCSWESSSAQYAALQNAFANDVTVVHSAGNDASDVPGFMDATLDYQAISVAATRTDDRRANFSNYGTWIDVSAPGQTIYSTLSTAYTPGYAYADGTSMAAPMVAGLSLLIRSMMPSLSRYQADSILINTTDNIDAVNPGFEGLVGTGRINAYSALQNLANAKFSADILEGNIPLSVSFTDLSPNSPTAWKWYFGDGDSSLVQNPAHTYLEPGAYTVSLLIDEPNGLGEEHLRNYIWAQADTMRIDSIEVEPGTKDTVSVYLRNTALVKKIRFSFTLPNSEGISWSGKVSIAGLRTESYFKTSITGYSGSDQRYEVELVPKTAGSTQYLPPGSGPVMNIEVNIGSSATPGAVVSIDTLTWDSHSPVIETIYGDYWPEFSIGKLVVAGCCGAYTGGYTGNTDCSTDGKRTLNDITALIDNVFITHGELCCPENGNVDGSADGKLTLNDVTRLIDNVFITHAQTAPCP
ncbi:MAG: S8 family serine peptidase [Candidatus Zixiibacteriota bacterium]